MRARLGATLVKRTRALTVCLVNIKMRRHKFHWTISKLVSFALWEKFNPLKNKSTAMIARLVNLSLCLVKLSVMTAELEDSVRLMEGSSVTLVPVALSNQPRARARVSSAALEDIKGSSSCATTARSASLMTRKLSRRFVLSARLVFTRMPNRGATVFPVLLVCTQQTRVQKLARTVVLDILQM
jgi:hypothetical protein